MDIEIWSDIACPWCYVGKRRLAAALSRFEHADEVTVTWRSFELDPSAPLERRGEGAAHLAERSFELDPSAPLERRGEGAAHLAEKYGMSVEQARASQAGLAQTAAGDGIEMRFDIQRMGRTFDAHRLVHLAAEHGLADAMKERLMHAYFSEGRLMSDHDTLLELAAEVGLDRELARETLSGDRYAEEVRADEHDAQQLGISAVPTFVIDRQIGVSGAQPPEQLLAFLQEGWRRQEAGAPAPSTR